MPSICDILLSVGFKFDRSCFFLDEVDDDVVLVVAVLVVVVVVVVVVDDDDDDAASKISFFISSLNLHKGELTVE